MSERFHTNSRTADYFEEAFSRHSAWILGVCSGIANRIGVHVAILRVVTVGFLVFMPLKTIVVYLLLWAIFFRRRRY